MEAGTGAGGLTRCDAVTAAYDSRGRFVERTFDCLGRATSRVMGRDRHGLPTETRRHTNVAASAYVTDTVAYTARGLAYFTKSETGAHMLTTRSKAAHAQCPATGTAFHERVRNGGGGESVRCFDRLAREVRTATTGFAANTWIHRDTEYDRLGRVTRHSEPYYSTHTGCQKDGGQSKCHTTTAYDILGRVTSTTLPDGSVATVAYDGLETTHTNALNQTRTATANALGETVETTDHLDGRITFDHDTQGNLTGVTRHKADSDSTAAPAQIKTTMAYDLLGRKQSMVDPDKGAWRYRHNALGELTCQESAAGHFSVMGYDGLGRLRSRKDYRDHAADCDSPASAAAAALEGDAAWRYDGGHGLGQLTAAADAVSGYEKRLTHDRLGRLSETATRPGTGNGWHYEKTTYDGYGRVFQAFDASRGAADYSDHGVRYVHNARGHLEKLQDAVGVADGGGTFTPQAVHRTVTAMDARGNVTGETLGNGVARRHGFDGRTGRLLSIRSGRLSADDRQDLAYDWDALGNLRSRTRTRSGNALAETFTYDGLNRLETHRTGSGTLNSVTYDSYGNIRTRTGVGTYAYGAGGAGPHAVTSIVKGTGHTATTVTHAYDANGNNVSSSDGRAIAHTAFDKPKSITKGGHATAFAYGPDRARFMRTDTVTEGTGGKRLASGGDQVMARPDCCGAARRLRRGVRVREGTAWQGASK